MTIAFCDISQPYVHDTSIPPGRTCVNHLHQDHGSVPPRVSRLEAGQPLPCADCCEHFGPRAIRNHTSRACQWQPLTVSRLGPKRAM